MRKFAVPALAVFLTAMTNSALPAPAKAARGPILDRQETANWISETRPGLRCITDKKRAGPPQCVKIGGPEIGYNPIESLFGRGSRGPGG